MINISGKKYYLDLKKISDFVNYSSSHPTKESEIVDVYESKDGDDNGDVNLTAKTTKEVNSYGESQIDNIRYDLVKILTTQVIGFGFAEGDDATNIPFGFEVAFNTLINEGFLIEM